MVVISHESLKNTLQSSYRYVTFTQILIGFFQVSIGILHWWQLSHPLLSPVNESSISTTFLPREQWSELWETIAVTSESIRATETGLILTIESGAPTAIRLRNHPAPASERPWASFLRPIPSEYPRDYEASISFTVITNRTLSYLGLVSIRRLTIQIVNDGILITSPKSPRDVDAIFIPQTIDERHLEHVWDVRAFSQEVTIRLDGTQIWKGRQFDPFDDYVIGVPRKDPLHGGRIELRHVSVSKRIFLTTPSRHV